MSTSPTYFGLLVKFGAAEIPLEALHEKYFNISLREAKQRAWSNKLPVPCYKAGYNESQWLVSADEPAKHLDGHKAKATGNWNRLNA